MAEARVAITADTRLSLHDAPGAITSDTRALELVDETPPQSAVTKKRFSIKHEK